MNRVLNKGINDLMLGCLLRPAHTVSRSRSHHPAISSISARPQLVSFITSGGM